LTASGVIPEKSAPPLPSEAIRWPRKEERRAGEIIKARLRGGAAIAVIARGSARDHCPITSFKIPVTSSKMATAHPPQPRRTLKRDYTPDLQWNGLLHCPSDASQ
jgi:hypothetical protein